MANTDPEQPRGAHPEPAAVPGAMIRAYVDDRLQTGFTRAHFSEEQRQAVLLALGELSLERPGWDMMLREIAVLLFGEAMFDEFKRLNADRIRPACTESRPENA
jgi:hypothetical protein